MGYSFYLISKEKEINKHDFTIAMFNLSPFNKEGFAGKPPCDIGFKKHYIRVSGSFTISGKLVEGFVLNLLICLTDLQYKIKVISKDWEYGTEEDWKWLESIN